MAHASFPKFIQSPGQGDGPDVFGDGKGVFARVDDLEFVESEIAYGHVHSPARNHVQSSLKSKHGMFGFQGKNRIGRI